MTSSADAKAFLDDDPAKWLARTETLCSLIIDWLIKTSSISRTVLQRTQIRDMLFAELTSPTFVRLFTATKSGDEAGILVSYTAKELLDDQIQVEADLTDEESEWGDIIDLGPGNMLVRRWDSDDFMQGDYTDAYANRLLAEYQSLQLNLDWKALSSAVADTLKSPPAAVPQTSVLRLDVIDLALYQALCQHPELLRMLDWRTFEKLLADILDSFGFEVELQRGTKDGGIDIFAVMKNHPIGPQRYLLQAKRWNNAVGLEPVRQLAFLHAHYKATKSCLATTATFTRGAWELANQYRWQIELKDYDGLVQWVKIASRCRYPR